MYLPFRVVLYSHTNYITYQLPQNSCILNTAVSCAVIAAGIAQSGVLNPADTQDSSVLLTVRTGLGPSQSPVQSITRFLSPQVRRSGRKADDLVPRLRKSGTVPPLLVYAFMAHTGTLTCTQPISSPAISAAGF
jgi:hypothetical protein